ncbi:hypothetical protein AWB67_05946 [Caballeronia terrestris]|jgi:hypothetical protein|uniref:Uncharacterized protein n=1 Tax=Caballeronia terrestris TaxID=1226301 RepID=A0A158KLF8_9BURK|nr:hypothetical protein AWB67_05946 [Caballeronia terrestris]
MTSFGSTDSATRHLKPSVGPMHATSERVARGRMYDCCTCPLYCELSQWVREPSPVPP